MTSYFECVCLCVQLLAQARTVTTTKTMTFKLRMISRVHQLSMNLPVLLLQTSQRRVLQWNHRMPNRANKVSISHLLRFKSSKFESSTLNRILIQFQAMTMTIITVEVATMQTAKMLGMPMTSQRMTNTPKLVVKKGKRKERQRNY